MQKITFLITCFMCIIQVLYAQSNFVDVTILKKDGKAILGQIDYQEWRKNPQKVLFRTSDGSVRAYFPEQITGFVIKENGEYYLSAIVTFNVETLNSAKLNEFNSFKAMVR